PGPPSLLTIASAIGMSSRVLGIPSGRRPPAGRRAQPAGRERTVIVDRDGTAEGRRVVELKTPGEIEAIRAAGTVVAEVLGTARAHAAAGITLKELDEAAPDILKKAGATSPFLNYRPRFAPTPYPAVICTSVNDAALHGIPS